jgi:hypothetical protein
MEPSFRDLGKLLLFAGIALAAVGAILMAGGRQSFRLGRLPGDTACSGPTRDIFPDRHLHCAQLVTHTHYEDRELPPALTRW